jgi:SAM-dependent methyltransferase
MGSPVTSRAATDAGPRPGRSHQHVCPWWLGYFLVSPLRRLLEKPEKILGPRVRPGMRVLEVGSGMGFFTLPLADMVGQQGRVVCVDVQPRMLESLARRARRAGVLERIETRVCGPGDLGIADQAGTIDLAVLIHVLHEIPDAAGALVQVRAALKPDGHLVFIEPAGHVSARAFQSELDAAARAGLEVSDRLALRRRHGAVLRRSGSRATG